MGIVLPPALPCLCGGKHFFSHAKACTYVYLRNWEDTLSLRGAPNIIKSSMSLLLAVNPVRLWMIYCLPSTQNLSWYSTKSTCAPLPSCPCHPKGNTYLVRGSTPRCFFWFSLGARYPRVSHTRTARFWRERPSHEYIPYNTSPIHGPWDIR